MNCIIETIDFDTMDFKMPVTIKNCIINKLLIHSCWFRRGLIFKSNVVNSYVDYQMGGHNQAEILVEGNIFVYFVDFFDCLFEEIVVVRNNIFQMGTNLLGNKNEGFANVFNMGYQVHQNLGDVSLDKSGNNDNMQEK